jgi:2'-5' RNA ligase
MTPGDGERSLRLFVAVEMPEEVRRALADAVDMLRRAGVDEGLRWVRPQGIHVTI